MVVLWVVQSLGNPGPTQFSSSANGVAFPFMPHMNPAASVANPLISNLHGG